MAAGERRRATARTARLIALATANVLAAILLVRLLTSEVAGGGEDEKGELPTAVQVEQSPEHAVPLERSPRTSVAGPSVRPDPGTAAGPLAQAVGVIVERYTRRAVENGRGRIASGDVSVAVHVRRPGAERPSVDLAPDAALRPASNMKLVTTAAALVLLGTEACFTTPFEAAGPLVAGELRGDLVVRGGGDPLLDPAGEGAVGALLEPVIAALWARGLRSVGGELVLDEGNFPAPGPGPEWPDPGQHWAEYCALAGGFTANAGCLTATVVPGPVGSAASVRVRPSPHGLEELLGVTTRAGGPLSVAVGATATTARVTGSIPAGVGRWSARFAHPDPVELFAHVLVDRLRRRGIHVPGWRRERGVVGGERLATLRTPVLATLEPINAESMNSVADQLFLATGLAHGGEASRAGAARASGEALRRLGVDPIGLIQVDGSGLSRANRLRAPQLAALLSAIVERGGDAAQAFRASLAVAGRSGTLRERMVDGPARDRVLAKSGWIAGTSALSGLARGLDGTTRVFCILVNYPDVGGLNTSCWKPMQDELCELLVTVQDSAAALEPAAGGGTR